MLCRSSIGEVSVKYRETFGQVSGNYRSGIGELSAKYRENIGRLSVEYRRQLSRHQEKKNSKKLNYSDFLLLIISEVRQQSLTTRKGYNHRPTLTLTGCLQEEKSRDNSDSFSMPAHTCVFSFDLLLRGNVDRNLWRHSSAHSKWS